MRFEINIEELAGELWKLVRPEIQSLQTQALPSLLSRKDAARYLGISARMLDSLGIPRVEISDRCVRYRREDLDRFAQERIRA
ncbi:MAG: hypothetical protein O2968_11600 [Acidobacteria bacterium]|nr:hypothetical protein [Acidobacteriota bacterium]